MPSPHLPSSAAEVMAGASSLMAEPFKGPITVTLAYFVVYYLFCFGQTFMHTVLFATLKKKGESVTLSDVKLGRIEDPMVTAVNRMFLNTAEQAIPFLTSFWLYALLVDREDATLYGWVYVGLRAVYPLFLYLGLKFYTAIVAFSTAGQYLIIFYFLVKLAFLVGVPAWVTFSILGVIMCLMSVIAFRYHLVWALGKDREGLQPLSQ
uniref:Uncharacterized protein n=1 Tax=Chromera velia CCMP2878 TaxID=1169474 RepID=A0A0G4HEK1_9ALVE|eukprot:Cvel_26784.t1-p1 / transcript=Cvel_26784.t1 / gene=Cvel_26784 / organism=Chromera_velia_CCMP2878 / gene_product=hypothetical protein / transcript_product=hypothetical protein / location=Cvel_scaffold3241:16476-17093(+) / protein_length=206 / sequence_SO=supercontig / SO=protein_coding / is_pseudo=false